eukprot:TRINITY_DN7244_c1_g3_i2.p1 TRINITY_DN7244_c1_g3~~TRINITY_DN7244_c1_g3_i2.p1  ORF type:complete len:456 (-),score=27.00 TRINITY_DN7244_c1_g3_i2:361-1698(-)
MQQFHKAHKQFGNKWTQIALCLPGRTDNAIKNRWNSSLSKRLQVERSTKAKVNKSFDDTDLPLQKLSGLSSESLQLHAHKQQQLLQDEDFQYPSRQRCINAIEQEQQRKEAGNKYDVMNNFLNNSNPEYFPQLPDRNAIDNRNPLPMLTNRYSSQQQYNYDQEIKHNDSQSIDRLHDSDCLLHTQGPNFAPVVQLRKQHDMGLQFKSEYVDMHNRNMIGGRSIPISSQLIQGSRLGYNIPESNAEADHLARQPQRRGNDLDYLQQSLFRDSDMYQNYGNVRNNESCSKFDELCDRHMRGWTRAGLRRDNSKVDTPTSVQDEEQIVKRTSSCGSRTGEEVVQSIRSINEQRQCKSSNECSQASAAPSEYQLLNQHELFQTNHTFRSRYYQPVPSSYHPLPIHGPPSQSFLQPSLGLSSQLFKYQQNEDSIVGKLQEELIKQQPHRN